MQIVDMRWRASSCDPQGHKLVCTRRVDETNFSNGFLRKDSHSFSHICNEQCPWEQALVCEVNKRGARSKAPGARWTHRNKAPERLQRVDVAHTVTLGNGLQGGRCDGECRALEHPRDLNRFSISFTRGAWVDPDRAAINAVEEQVRAGFVSAVGVLRVRHEFRCDFGDPRANDGQPLLMGGHIGAPTVPRFRNVSRIVRRCIRMTIQNRPSFILQSRQTLGVSGSVSLQVRWRQQGGQRDSAL